jgi:hypothetical protein
MPNPWVSLRRDQLIPLNKVVNKKEQLEKGLEGKNIFGDFVTNSSGHPDGYAVGCHKLGYIRLE